MIVMKKYVLFLIFCISFLFLFQTQVTYGLGEKIEIKSIETKDDLDNGHGFIITIDVKESLPFDLAIDYIDTTDSNHKLFCFNKERSAENDITCDHSISPGRFPAMTIGEHTIDSGWFPKELFVSGGKYYPAIGIWEAGSPTGQYVGVSGHDYDQKAFDDKIIDLNKFKEGYTKKIVNSYTLHKPTVDIVFKSLGELKKALKPECSEVEERVVDYMITCYPQTDQNQEGEEDSEEQTDNEGEKCEEVGYSEGQYKHANIGGKATIYLCEDGEVIKVETCGENEYAKERSDGSFICEEKGDCDSNTIDEKDGCYNPSTDEKCTEEPCDDEGYCKGCEGYNQRRNYYCTTEGTESSSIVDYSTMCS